MSKIAIFPGSFDPITKGHEDLIKRALPLFDKLIVAIGVNADKKYMFSLEQRKAWIYKTFTGEENIEVGTYEGLTVDFCRTISAGYIVRGVRNAQDYQFESAIAQMNRELNGDVETIFLVARPEYTAISSTIVRDIHRNSGDVSRFIPNAIDLSE